MNSTHGLQDPSIFNIPYLLSIRFKLPKSSKKIENPRSLQHIIPPLRYLDEEEDEEIVRKFKREKCIYLLRNSKLGTKSFVGLQNRSSHH